MDKRARNILFSTYWQKGCWVSRSNRQISAEDFAYAKKSGLMFDPVTLSHDECVIRISRLAQAIPKDAVAGAFLSSLSSRRLHVRSAVASWACAERLVPHAYDPVPSGFSYENCVARCVSHSCRVCQDRDFYGCSEWYENEDLSVLNFERIKWGGVRLGNLIYTLFDLEQFQKEDVPGPVEADVAIFKQILAVVENCGPGAFPGVLRGNLSQIASLRSNKGERGVLMEILACIGVLRPLSKDRPTTGRDDWYFVRFWRGEDGYDAEIVQRFFGKYL